MSASHQSRIFTASCVALIVTAMTFAMMLGGLIYNLIVVMKKQGIKPVASTQVAVAKAAEILHR